MQRAYSLFGLVLVLSITSYGYVNTYYDDGGYHKIDYILDGQVILDENTPGAGTQLELVDGGGIAPGQGYGSICAFNDSQVTVSGGELGWSIWATDRSRARMTNGYLAADFNVSSTSAAILSGGSVRALVAYGNGSIDMSGGTVRWGFETQDSTGSIIRGGNIARINCLDSSRIDIYGGQIGYIFAGYYYDASSLITFYGSNFAVNGIPVTQGQYASSICLTGGTLSGTLRDGSILSTSFQRHGTADILFIPEPATVLLLGFGAFAVLKRIH